MSERRQQVEEIIYADGSIGYRNSPMITNDKTESGKPVEIVGVNDLHLTQRELRDKMRGAKDLHAEILDSHQVVIRPKTKKERQREFEESMAKADRIDQLKQEARKRRQF